LAVSLWQSDGPLAEPSPTLAHLHGDEDADDEDPVEHVGEDAAQRGGVLPAEEGAEEGPAGVGGLVFRVLHISSQ
jgi:hypothetical protein